MVVIPRFARSPIFTSSSYITIWNKPTRFLSATRVAKSEMQSRVSSKDGLREDCVRPEAAVVRVEASLNPSFGSTFLLDETTASQTNEEEVQLSDFLKGGERGHGTV